MTRGMSSPAAVRVRELLTGLTFLVPPATPVLRVEVVDAGAAPAPRGAVLSGRLAGADLGSVPPGVRVLVPHAREGERAADAAFRLCEVE